jgi:hypothetical protein
MVDHFSKKLWSFLIPNKNAETITDKLNVVIATINTPRIIQSDNGGEFVNAAVTAYVNRYNNVRPDNEYIRHITSLPYKPMTNGAIERLNRTVTQNLEAHIREKKAKSFSEFQAYHTMLSQEYNRQTHSITNFSPNDIYGSKDQTIIDIVKSRQLNAFKIDADNQFKAGQIGLIRDIFTIKSGNRIHPVVIRKRGKKGIFSVAVRVMKAEKGYCVVKL